jgi:hypothetical protein
LILKTEYPWILDQVTRYSNDIQKGNLKSNGVTK